MKPGPRAKAKQQITLSKAEVLAAEAHYLSGATLREAATPLGISHARFASIMREGVHKIRHSKPTEADIDQMVYRYEAGESLATIGKKLGFQANTVPLTCYEEEFRHATRTVESNKFQSVLLPACQLVLIKVKNLSPHFAAHARF